MKAIVQDRYGAPDVLRLEDVEAPLPADHEVLVRIHGAAVNARDWHVVRGDPKIARMSLPSVFGLTGPKRRIRGSDFAGRVAAVGRAVTRWRVGDEVYGERADASGAFAEYVCVADDAVGRKATNLTFEQAAAFPLAANTALIGVRDLGKVGPGHRILVNGASGGAGTFAVQLAAEFGAEVTGVCGPRHVDLVRSLGAHHVIDYTREDFAAGSVRYDVVFDLVGNRSLADCRRVLTPSGTFVLSGGGVYEGGSLVGPMGLILRAQVMSRFAGHRLVQLTATPKAENLARLTELAESGKVVPVIDRTYPLSAVPEAIRHVESGHARGKVVITV